MSRYWALPLWQGNNDPVEFVLRDGQGLRVDLTGAQARVRVSWPGGALVAASGVDPEIFIPDQSDPNDRGSIVWAPTLAQTRQMPLGRAAAYELELRDFPAEGRELTVLAGPVVVQGGNNADGVLA